MTSCFSPDGGFSHAIRWKDRIGSNALYYASVEDIPASIGDSSRT